MQFDHKYGWKLPMNLLGVGPKFSHISVDRGQIAVTMGWCFRLTAPTSTIDQAEVRLEPISWKLGVGVHCWRGEWAVNGARRPHVLISFKVPQQVRFLGIRMSVRKLHLSPTTPDALVKALRA